MPTVGYRSGAGQLPGGFYLYDARNPPGAIEERLAHAELLRQQAAEVQARRQAARDALLDWQNAAPGLLAPVTTPGQPATPDTTMAIPRSPDWLPRMGPDLGSQVPAGEQHDLGGTRATGVVTPGTPAVEPTSRAPTSTEVAGRGARYMTPADTIKQITESMDKDAAIAAGRKTAAPKTIPEIIAAVARKELDPTVARAQIDALVREEAGQAGAKKTAEFVPSMQFGPTGTAIQHTAPGVFAENPAFSGKTPPQPTPTTMALDAARYAITLDKGDQYVPSSEEVAAKAVSTTSQPGFKSLIPIIAAAREAEASGDTAKATDLRGLVRESITALSQVAGATTAAQQASLANAPMAAHGNLASRMLMPDGSGVDSLKSLPQLEASGAILFPSPGMMDAFRQGLLFERQVPEVLAAAKLFYGPKAVARTAPLGFFQAMVESTGTYLKTTKIGQGINPEAAKFIGQVKSLGLKLANVDNGGRPTEPDFDKAAGVLFGDFDTYESFAGRIEQGRRIARDSMTNMRKQAVKPTAATPVALPGGGSYAPVTE